MRRVKESEITAGKGLPWDVYDAASVMVAAEGTVLETAEEVAALLRRGVYTHGETREHRLARAKRERELAEERAQVHTFDRVALLPARLAQINKSFTSAPEPDLVERVRAFAAHLQELCAEDADAVLAALHVRYDAAPGLVEALHAAALCELLSAAAGMEEEARRSILCGALTHDIGFLDLQERLHKQTEPLSQAQWDEVHEHPIKGEEILIKGGVKDPVWLDVVRHHHERLDGTGYPDGLRDDEISPEVRILAIADIYSAMLKPRGYREAILAKDAVRDIFLDRGSSVDEGLTQLFIKRIGIFPPGAFVKLRNGEIAVVIRQSANAAHPRICSVLSPRGTPLPKPVMRDTSEKEFLVTEMMPHQKYRSILGMLHVLWRVA